MVFMQNGEHRFTAAIRNNTTWLNASTLLAPEAALRGEATMDRSDTAASVTSAQIASSRPSKGRLLPGLSSRVTPQRRHTASCVSVASITATHSLSVPATAPHRSSSASTPTCTSCLS
jgi:hypothetical protein